MRKTRNKRRSVMVGIFVFLAIALFAIAVFTLGGQQSVFARTISVYAIFENVEGLKSGNNVWFSGVKIGVVKEIKFTGKSDVVITMNLEQDATEYIRKNAMVVLSSEGFIGNKLIEIVGGTTDYPPVEDGDYLEVKSTTGTAEIMKTLQENNRNLLDITEDIKVLSDKAVKGEGLAGAIFSDNGMVQDVRNTLANLQQTSEAAERVIGGMNTFVNKLNRKDGLVNDLLTDTVIYSELRSAVAGLKRTSEQANRLTQSLNQATVKLNQTDNAAGVLLNDQAFAQDMQSTMSNLKTGTAELNQTLEALQRTFLLRRQIRKMEEEK